MAAGQGRRRDTRGVHQAGVALQDLVGRVAVAKPQLVGGFGCPCGRAFGPCNFPAQRILAALTDLAGGHRRPRATGKAQKDQRRIVGFHLAGLGRTLGRRTGFHRARGFQALGQKGGQVGQNGHRLLPRNKADKVQPMRPDIANRSQGTALIRLKPPVPVGRFGQPVLMILPGDQPDLAQPAIRHQLSRVLIRAC